MSVFKDKTYEGMDWLSQAVEPIHNPLNDFLAMMPDEYLIPTSLIFQSLAGSWNKSLNRETVVRHIYQNAFSKESNSLSWEDRATLEKCFAFELSPEPVVVEGGSSSGWIKLIKKVTILEDDVAQKMMARLSHLSVHYKDCKHDAIVELGTLLFEGSERKKEFDDCNMKGKLSYLMTYIANSAAEDVFKIRSVTAYGNFVQLLNNFLMTSDASNLGRIFKVIAMARNNQLTYDIEAPK